MKVLRRAWLVVFALASAFVLLLVVVRVAERGRFAAAYSSYGSGPTGTRALYLVLEQLGVPMQRWPSDLARLPQGAVLLALGGCEAEMARPLSRYEREELTRWVGRGGVLFVAGARSYVPADLGVRFEQAERCVTGSDPENPAPAERWALPVAPLLAGLAALPMRNAGPIFVEPGRPHDVLLGAPTPEAASTTIHDDDVSEPSEPNDPSPQAEFAPLGVSVPYGRGRVIVLASASLFTNSAVMESLGAALMVRLLDAYAPRSRVLVDEYHLGVGERRSLMRYMREMGAAEVALLLALVALLWLWRGGARFGPLVREEEPVPEGTASFASAMGQLYASSKDEEGALAILVRHACARIAAYHHVAFGSSGKLERALRERSAFEAADAVRDLATLLRNDAERPLAARVARIDRAVARATRSRAPT